MPCFCPYPAWKSKRVEASGKRKLVFKPQDGISGTELEVPCGQCIGCRIVRARQWAVRCIHEASLHEQNCFLTLTYNDENMPSEVKVSHVQLFMKRLREKIEPVKVRFFCVGEYGEKFSRPHYHLLLFGYDFPDKYYWCGKGKSRQYRSSMLEKLWTDGFSTIGSVTPASAQYVAQYCTKIITGKKKAEHYGDKAPEFAIMSRKPGLGTGWLEKYGNVLFDRDFVVVDGGKRLAVPRFYLDKFPDDIKAEVKLRRKLKNEDNPDNCGSRAIARAECAYRKVSDGKRGYENG